LVQLVQTSHPEISQITPFLYKSINYNVGTNFEIPT
jgi:hypothetical protein